MKIKNLFNVLLLLSFAVLFLQSCDEENEPAGKGEAEFKMTDAPSDDANIKSVFVTVTDIKVDGNSIQGFTKQTIDLKAYQDGDTKLMGASELDAKTYNNLTLVLDLDHDAHGAAPGCYVETTDGTKHKLQATADGTMSITMNKAWEVSNNAKSSIVMDFDLRKSIRHEANATSAYSFVAQSDLNAAVRVVNEAKTGTVVGDYSESSSSNAEKVIVYAYKRGTFNAETEPAANFKNAVSSAEIKSSFNGETYTLAFLEEGEYELHFAGYTADNSGRFTFNGQVASQTEIEGGGLIKVQSGVTLSLSSVISFL